MHSSTTSKILSSSTSSKSSPSSSSSSNIGRSLYKRILRELRATRNFDHHLRDIRFLLWVPGTKGKRQYDELKRLAQMSASLHRTRNKNTTNNNNSQSSSSTVAQQDDREHQSPLPKEPAKKKNSPAIINVSPSIADQIRAVARGLFRREQEKLDELTRQQMELLKTPKTTSESNSTSSSNGSSPPLTTAAEISVKKATMITEGTRRAFWAIKRLQDIRGGLVPNASMWLVQGGGTNAHYHNYLGLSRDQNPQTSTAAAAAALLMGNSSSNLLPGSSSFSKGTSSSSSSSTPTKMTFPTSFDPFSVPTSAQMRSGNFPFIREFLGIDEHGKSSLSSSSSGRKRGGGGGGGKSTSVTSNNNSSDDPVENQLAQLQTFGKSKNKVLKLELVSRCAAKDGPAARYHLSFRLENISEFAVDVKLAHLFAVKVEQPPSLDEMVCLLPLFGNSILSPFSSSAFNDENNNDDEDESNNNNDEEDDSSNELNSEHLQSVPRNRRKAAAAEEDLDNSDDHDTSELDEDESSSAGTTPPSFEAPHHQFSRKIREDPAVAPSTTTSSSASSSSSSSTSNPQTTSISSSTTASLPHINHSKSTAPDFTAKARTPDHCAVYDVTFPVQGECVLRGFLLYRTISNAFPSASGKDGEDNGGAEQTSTSSQSSATMPSSVKSRLKVLHLPVIKLQPPQ